MKLAEKILENKSDMYKDDSVEIFYKKTNESLDESKSKEASMFLKLMDSEHEELGYQTLLDIVVVATGVNKKKLDKELETYI